MQPSFLHFGILLYFVLITVLELTYEIRVPSGSAYKDTRLRLMSVYPDDKRPLIS